MQTKAGIVKILKDFRVEMTPTTPTKIRFAKRAIVGQSEVPIVLKFVKDSL